MEFKTASRIHCPGHRIVLAFFLAAAAFTSVPARDRAPSHDSSALPPPLETLVRSFRSGSPGPLKELLHGAGKIRASCPALGMKSGYYSADQIYFMFQDVFQNRRTLQFHIVRGAEIPPGAERMVVLARWTYRRGSSRNLTTEISFDLARRSGVWCLQEIKEML